MFVQLCPHKEQKDLGKGQVEQRPEVVPLTSLDRLFADQCVYQLRKEASPNFIFACPESDKLLLP